MKLKQVVEAVAADHTNLAGSGFSSVLDCARWISALCVLLMHAHHRIFTPLRDLHDPGLAAQLFYYSVNFGHQAVIVFFVLSGYLVGGRSLVSAARGRFDLRNYAAARLARLFTVLVPALALTAASDVLANHISNNAGFQGQAGTGNLGWWPLIANLLMLQSFYAPTFGSNIPLWSLSFEFWFYFTFAVGIQLYLDRRRVWLWFFITCLIAILLGPRFIVYATMWSLGAAAAVVPASSRNVLPIALPTFVASVVASRVLELGQAASDLFQSVGAALLLWSLKSRSLPFAARMKGGNSTLAAFSYSLYAIHYPLLLLLLTYAGGPYLPMQRSMRLEPRTESVLLFVATVTVVFLASWLFAWLTERHTDYVKQRLSFILRHL